MEGRCSFCNQIRQGISWHTLPCGHVSCSLCDAKYNNGFEGPNSLNAVRCLICVKQQNEGLPQTSIVSPAAPYRPFMKQFSPNSQHIQRVPQPVPPFSPFEQKMTFADQLSSIPTFVPRDPHLIFPAHNPPNLKGSQQSFDMKNGSAMLRTDAAASFVDNYSPFKEEGFVLEKNLNAVHVGLKARVSDVFDQIMRALCAHQETINNALDERFAHIGERISCHDKSIDNTIDVSAEVYKVTQEINAKLAEAKLMIDVINSLESKKTLSAFFDYLSSGHGGAGDGSADLTPIIDTTLSKPMIRSWSDSTSQAAVLITWTTPRDFELLHRSEGFWYELEQRLAEEPDTAWRNVYKGVERTFVCKNMHKGKRYLFRCCVCVARHRYSNWSPEVLIVPGTGLPDGKHSLITPEISKALEQEVARNFTSGAVSAAGASGPAVVTTVIVPINNNHMSPPSSPCSTPSSSSSSPLSPTLPAGDSPSGSPGTASSTSPSPPVQSSSSGTTAITTITTDPAEAASTIVSMSSSAAAVAAAMAAHGGGIPGAKNPAVGSFVPSSFLSEDDHARGGRTQRSAPLASFAPGPYYELSQSNKVATALQPGAIVLGQAFSKNSTTLFSVRILRGSGIFIGVVPSNINQVGIRQHLYNGWFLDTATLSIGSHPPYKWKPKPAYPKGDPTKQQCIYFPHEGDIVSFNFNSKTNCLRFSTMPGAYLPGKYTCVSTPGCRIPLVPAVVLINAGDSVLLHSAVQGAI